jgi:hypothetical protein
MGQAGQDSSQVSIRVTSIRGRSDREEESRMAPPGVSHLSE